MRKSLLPRASPDDPVVGNRRNPSLLSSWGWRNVPFPSSPLYLGCSPPKRDPGHTSGEEDVCVLDEGFHHTHHLDGGDRGQVQLHGVSERQGWFEASEKGFWGINPFGVHS